MKLIGRLAAASFFAAMTFFAVEHVQANLQFATVTKLGTQIFRGKPVAPADIERVAETMPHVALLETCRSDLLQNALRIELPYLDMLDPDGDYERWSNAMLSGEALIEHIKKCNPGNGDIWLREAMMTQVIAEEPQRIADNMLMATALLPSWQPALIARLNLWNRLSEKSLDYARSSLMQDLVIMVSYFPPKEVQALNEVASDPLRPYLDEALVLLPPDKREAIINPTQK